MTRIAIIGGHGKVALYLARILGAEGHDVTSLFRNPEHEADVVATGAAPVVADVEHQSVEEIAAAIVGHDVVVWTAGAGGGSAERTYAVDRDAAIRAIDAAVAADVPRFVMVSYKGAGPNHGVPPENSFFAYAESKAAADAHLRQSDLDWTVLGPSALTDDPGTGRIEVGARLESTHVSREDVARVAAAVLEAPWTTKTTIDFNVGDVPIAEAVRSA
ncbi:NAD(P)H-binding protein [Sanguibacter antarcticus]|uniref:Putative NADH-flavin reductase n=1 Tax=Sanguibacter antarcticus TaxID=372484 RepID=A0A2A9E9L0_9MICO|nr:NAD(P)H-binding protein [Sanguibacter antarcticus]PFG35231.1 putative NADH-flavin reductase [Sanguibacter antarcticus]